MNQNHKYHQTLDVTQHVSNQPSTTSNIFDDQGRRQFSSYKSKAIPNYETHDRKSST